MNNKKTYCRPYLHVAIISHSPILAGSNGTGSIEAGGIDGNGDHSLPADAKESTWLFDIDE